jgi:hypothetical protein
LVVAINVAAGMKHHGSRPPFQGGFSVANSQG